MKWNVLCLLLLAAGCGKLPDEPPPKVLPPARAAAADPMAGGTIVDLDGREVNLASNPAIKAIALIFILPDCPICNAYLPELTRMHESYASRGVSFALVHAEAGQGAEEARRHARDFQIPMPVTLDPNHVLAKKAGATVAPEAAVFSPAGELLYRGRIDNQYAGWGKRRAVVTSHDLREALEAVLAGQPVAEPRTQPIGCPIPERSRGD